MKQKKSQMPRACKKCSRDFKADSLDIKVYHGTDSPLKCMQVLVVALHALSGEFDVHTDGTYWLAMFYTEQQWGKSLSLLQWLASTDPVSYPNMVVHVADDSCSAP